MWTSCELHKVSAFKGFPLKTPNLRGLSIYHFLAGILAVKCLILTKLLLKQLSDRGESKV